MFDFTFKGSIDGDGHTLSSVYPLGDGLFDSIDGATFKDLTVNLSIDYERYQNAKKDLKDVPTTLGLICDYAYGSNKFDEVSVSGQMENRFDQKSGDTVCVGSFIGEIHNGSTEFSSCTSSVTLSAGGEAKHYAGGFVGYVGSDVSSVKFSSCDFTGKVSTISEGNSSKSQ